MSAASVRFRLPELNNHDRLHCMIDKNTEQMGMPPKEKVSSEAEPTLIWHYTTAPVLPKLFEKDAVMYATHTSFLNDRTECSIAADTFKLYYCQQYSWGMMDFEDIQRGSVRWRTAVHAPFVACFSTLRDDLSQWRAYASGGGYAIGFDLDLMKKELVPVKEIATALVSVQDFRKCTYISKEREVQLKKDLEFRGKMLASRPLREKQFKLSPQEIAQEEALTREILRETMEAVFYKNIGFQAENEIRFAILYDSLSGAIPDTTIINGSPRVPIHLRHPIWWYIREIVVGPTGDAEKNRILAEYLSKGVRLECLKTNGPIFVVPSEIPFRS